ncbi:MAG: sulfatase-like hydrolase/transferase [Prevotella sp.]|nr:sulfatase-like hydrolase/transferase [Prevotella sp.]
MNKNQVVEHNPIYLIFKSFIKLYLIIGAVMRVVLACTSPQDASYNIWEIARSLLVGAVTDLGMGLLLAIPMLITTLGLNERKYKRPYNIIILTLLALAFGYALWPKSVFKEYGGGAPLIARLLLGWKLLSFALRAFLPSWRRTWRHVSLYVLWTVYVFCTLFVAAGEFFFWQEFGVRYNFIAVDYLVYTHEVIGNIMESYAIIPLMGALVALTALYIWVEARHMRFRLTGNYTPKILSAQWGIYLLLSLAGYGVVTLTHSLDSDNQYVTQLEQNGAYDFLLAFRSNKLEYDRFYPMMGKEQCKMMYDEMCGLSSQGTKVLATDTVQRRKNVVLVTVESLSADFLTRYGNKQHITPFLDRLIGKSTVFDSLYANGNRTVRGLEALSLCVPPSAGESIIKQTDNRMGSLSVGNVLRSEGYTVQFLYGGDSYFDNMGDFFSHNGYEVIDRSSIAKDKITFANVWGVCDEDIFRKSIEVFNNDYKKGKPFFAQIMTTSNHRPYTYPAGRISYPGDPNCREAAVKYTDYAISRLIGQAAKEPWFKNTVFVIIADHCASSAGKTSLPIEKYHIPCIVFDPSQPVHRAIKKTCSQIDVMPTLLSWLGVRAKVRFAGGNVLGKSFHERAFMATYQDLGYMEGHCLTVLSPVRKVKQYALRRLPDGTWDETLMKQTRPELVRKAQAYYQYVNLYLRRK